MLANICMYMVPDSDQTLGTAITGAYKLFHAWLQNKSKKLSKNFCIHCMAMVFAFFRLA